MTTPNFTLVNKFYEASHPIQGTVNQPHFKCSFSGYFKASFHPEQSNPKIIGYTYVCAVIDQLIIDGQARNPKDLDELQLFSINDAASAEFSKFKDKHNRDQGYQKYELVMDKYNGDQVKTGEVSIFMQSMSEVKLTEFMQEINKRIDAYIQEFDEHLSWSDEGLERLRQKHLGKYNFFRKFNEIFALSGEQQKTYVRVVKAEDEKV